MEQFPGVVQILILAVWMSAVPAAAGACLCRAAGAEERKGGARLLFFWVSGQMLLWGIFQLICVPFVLMEREFGLVVKLFGAAAVLLAVCGVVLSVISARRGSLRALAPARGKGFFSDRRVWLWLAFAALLLLQLAQAVRLAYGDGDDAYYVAVSTITENAETMYQKLPYTGGTTEVDIRHGLAPFPIWIAFLARVSGVRAVSVAHVAVPLMLISMTYGIFYLLGKKLFAKKERLLPLFLIFTELLVIFGDYSFYTVENFMIARSRQGKSALGSIVLPMLFLLLLTLLERLQENQKYGAGNWILLCCAILAGCLCSTMGAFLLCMLLAVTGLCAAVGYRKWKVLVPLALCCVPCVGYALIYVLA
ncbi:MAG: DUF6077 domain-containing protein [Lachnospiraceae bacterium]|nr:DUF6077 domain-containing protein [Lachnospiraceae bacterium]